MAHTVSLSWVASTDAVDGYNVYRINGTTTTKINTALVVGTTFTDPTPLGGSDSYEVKSSLGGVESVASNVVSVVVPPSPPTNLVAVLS